MDDKSLLHKFHLIQLDLFQLALDILQINYLVSCVVQIDIEPLLNEH